MVLSTNVGNYLQSIAPRVIGEEIGLTLIFRNAMSPVEDGEISVVAGLVSVR